MAGPNGKGTFILGVGAQKAGTTWLYKYLEHYESANMGSYKEYHVWDAITLPELNNFKLSNTILAQNFLRAASQGRLRRIPLLRKKMQQNEDFYFGYFDSLLGRDGKTLTADITPTYSALPEAVLTKIYKKFSERDIDVKLVYLMRDPVQRCLSAAKMAVRQGKTNKSEVDALQRSYNAPGTV